MLGRAHYAASELHSAQLSCGSRQCSKSAGHISPSESHRCQSSNVSPAADSFALLQMLPYALSVVCFLCERVLVAPQGAFLNDACVLDLRTYTWRRPSVLAASPMGRHGALAAVLGGRVVMACGASASGPLDSIVTMTADFGARLGT